MPNRNIPTAGSGPAGTSAGTIKSLRVEDGLIEIGSALPPVETSGKLYNNGGTVYWNGIDLTASAGTTYDLLCPSGTTAIRLDPSTGSNDDITITAGTGISVTRNSGTQITIANTVAETPPTLAADDITLGDAASSFATSSGNVVVDSQAGSVSIDGHTGVTLASSNSGNVVIDSQAGSVSIDGHTGVTLAASSSGNVVVDSQAGSVSIDGHTGVTLASSNSGHITLDSVNNIVLDAAGGEVNFQDAGVDQLLLDMDGTAGAQVIKLSVDGDDLLFQQFDGRTILSVVDDGYVAIANGATGPGELRIYEDTDLSSNYSALTVGTQSADLTYTLPTAYPASSGYTMNSTDAGVMSWTAPVVPIANADTLSSGRYDD